eukprot:jgi/Hompol1/6448/HPOL_001713-RA
MYIRAASNGDIGRVQECLTTDVLDWIDLDAADEDGTTALISAACFGHVDIINILVEAGAQVDQKDKNGWTALMWACANGYEEAAKLLIEFGADKQAKSSRGRSIVDLSTKNGNFAIVRILDPELADKRERKAARAAAKAARKLEGASADGSRPPSSAGVTDDAEDSDSEDLEEPILEDEDEDLLIQDVPFEWDKCRPDQMFVFDENIIDHILDIAVRRIRPTRGPDYVPVGANVIFLCARYAHYYNSTDMLREFLNRAIKKIVSVIKSSPDDVHMYAYWLSNVMQLLVYMKRDTGLLLSTFEAQCLLSELVEQTFELLVATIERSILNILDAAVVDFKKLLATSRVRYEPVFFGLGKRKSLLKINQQYTPPRSPRSLRSARSSIVPQYEISPASINSIFSSTLNVLKSCKVHEQVVHQLFHQLLHFLNAELFNRIITTHEVCCRARAQQIQMNLASIQGWVREHAAATTPETLSASSSASAAYAKRGAMIQHIRPTMQLTQFLQVISTVDSLEAFHSLRKSLDALTIPQCHKAMQNYRYEVGEASFPTEVEAYLQKQIDRMILRHVSGDRDGKLRSPRHELRWRARKPTEPIA